MNYPTIKKKEDSTIFNNICVFVLSIIAVGLAFLFVYIPYQLTKSFVDENMTKAFVEDSKFVLNEVLFFEKNSNDFNHEIIIIDKTNTKHVINLWFVETCSNAPRFTFENKNSNYKLSFNYQEIQMFGKNLVYDEALKCFLAYDKLIQIQKLKEKRQKEFEESKIKNINEPFKK